MSTTTTITNNASTPTLYFAFGSNLWLHQMSLRCPASHYLGLARLSSYRWIINERGYANVVEIPDASNTSMPILAATGSGESGGHDYRHEVWGMVYSLNEEDEAALDKNEGVPHAYTKHYLECDFWELEKAWPVNPSTSTDVTNTTTTSSSPSNQHPSSSSSSSSRFPPPLDPSIPPTKTVTMLVYVDLKRVTASTPREEYVYRMNRGIDDMVGCGVSEGYVEGVLRGYIPSDDDKEGREVAEFARGQARGFRDESGIF